MLTRKNLHPYQRKIANFIIEKNGSFIIAEMGLGKTAPTLYAISYLQQERQFKNALIIAPLRVVYNSWPQELLKWNGLKDIPYHIVHGKGKIPVLPKKKLYFSNYETLPYIEKYKLYKNCDILIIDESSFVKNYKTQRFKILKKIIRKFKKVVLLTGTPSPSGTLIELFSQTYLIDKGKRLGESFWMFRKKYYEQTGWFGYDWELRKDSREKIKKKVFDISIVLRSKDYLELPSKIESQIMVKLPPKVCENYKAIEKDFILSIKEGVVTVSNAAVLSSKLRQICAGAIYHEDGEYTLLHDEKLLALKEIIETTESNILCAFQFKFEKTIIKRRFPYARFIDGSSSATESTDIINDWNNRKVKLLCCHPASVGHGLNLQDGGNVLVWLSPDWSLERTLQMNARLYRQGQSQKVFIYTIVCKETIDLAVVKALSFKNSGQNSFTNALINYYKNN